MDVRPKQFARGDRRHISNSEYTLVETLAVPDTGGHGNCHEFDLLPRRKTSRSLTSSPLSQRRKSSLAGYNPPPTYKSLHPTHSTTSFDGGKKSNNDDMEGLFFPPKLKVNGSSRHGRKLSSSFGKGPRKVKSTESIEMVDDFDAAGPLLASSRKSLCGEGKTGGSGNQEGNNNNKYNKNTKAVKTNIPPSDTLVLNDDEFEQYVQLSQNMVLQHQVKVKMPFPAGSVIYIRGREVILAIALFFFLTLSLGLVVAITRDKSNKTKHNSTVDSSPCTVEFCTTPKLMKNMSDFTVNPCDNFWKYSCGGWLKNSIIPTHQKSWDVSKEIESKIDQRIRKLLEIDDSSSNETANNNRASEKARIMYRQCMKPTESTENLNMVLEDLWTFKGK